MIRVRVGSRPSGRLLCFDLENRPLAYWYDGNPTSEITAFGWKWSDERKVHTMLLQPSGVYLADDGTTWEADLACCLFVSELEKAGLVYGHNIRRHDLPMLNAHLLRLGVETLKPLLTTDTLRDLPTTAGVSRSLENMASMYRLPGKKYVMSQPMWEDANRLTEGGIALARKRVASDVLLQERLRAKLLELGLLKRARTWAP